MRAKHCAIYKFCSFAEFALFCENSIFGKEPMTFPLSQTDANNLMNKIAGELSPENLHCDGEISHAQARQKYRQLTTIKSALETYCLNNWLDTPECVY